MDRLAHATCSKGLPPVSLSRGDHPSADKKLGSTGNWNFKPSRCCLPDVEGPVTAEVNTIAGTVLEQPFVVDEEEQEPENYFRFIGETQSIRELFHKAAICGQCKKGKLEVTFKSNCVATWLHTKCDNCLTHCASSTTPTSIPQEDGRLRNSYHGSNVLLVFSQILSGNGGTETGRLVGMLDLPNLSIAKTAFLLLESELARYIIPYTGEILEQNLVREVKLYSEKEGFDFESWHALLKKKSSDVDLLPLLTVAYDMAWQKRSSGHRYDSHSGHAIPTHWCTAV
jgi:hypothetical protein